MTQSQQRIAEMVGRGMMTPAKAGELLGIEISPQLTPEQAAWLIQHEIPRTLDQLAGIRNPFLDGMAPTGPSFFSYLEQRAQQPLQLPPVTWQSDFGAQMSSAAAPIAALDGIELLRERIKQLETELAQAKRPQVCDICRGLMDVEKAVAAEMAPAQESKAPDPDDDVPF